VKGKYTGKADFMIRILLLILVMLTAAPCAGIPPEAMGGEYLRPAFEQGREDAKEDVMNGKLVYYIFGAPAPWDHLLAEMLRNEYSIMLRSGGCNPGSEHFQRAEGYNTISVPAIEEKYGSVLRELSKKAEEEWANRNSR